MNAEWGEARDSLRHDSATSRLVLARHGETAANRRHVLDMSLLGEGLTERGAAQSHRLGCELAGDAEGPIRAVYSSTAVRARETAATIADLVGVGPTVLDGVHEVQVGALEGRGDEEAMSRVTSMYLRWARGELEVRADGKGENGHDVVERLVRAVAAIRADHPGGGTVVLVGHGLSLRVVARHLVGSASTPPPWDDHLDNCGRVVLDASPGWSLVRWLGSCPQEVDHLESWPARAGSRDGQTRRFTRSR